MDLNETFGLYRVDPELMQGQRFNFRSEAQTGKILHGIIVGSSGKIQFPVFSSRPEIKNLLMQKFTGNCILYSIYSIYPESFIQIWIVVSEEKRDQP